MSGAIALPVDSGTLIQEMIYPKDVRIEQLYLRYITGHSEVVENSLCLEEGAKVSFNTYFNSFYESYWDDISCISDLFLEIEFSGSVLVEVFRDTKNNGCHKINFVQLDSNSLDKKTITLGASAARNLRQKPRTYSLDRRTITLGALDLSVGETGRIFIDITAREKSQVAALRFKTNTKPRRQAKISVGICTFNREKFLLRNLRALLALPSIRGSLAKIVVVNQGPQFGSTELAELVRNSGNILLVEQSNLGGCGGFTRTMHEALKLEGVTHHVLMDDDAVIDARVLEKLLALLSFINDDMVVGGHMLDLMRPHFLYEAGAQVRYNTRINPMHHNIDLRAVDSLIPFNKYHSVDYNAWWFCAIPIEHIRAAEFPAPIFIRGDDMEYGLRLQERGVKTVAMPGIAVWHEPFYVKVGGWQTYYDLRNRLILASTYPHRFKHESPLHLLWWMLKAAASHDYLTAALLVKAVRDYLHGPSFLEKGAGAVHAEVVALAKSLAQPSVAESELPAPPAKLRCMPKSDWAHGLLVAYRIAMTLLFANRRSGATLLLDREANLSNIGPKPYIKTNGPGSYRLRYEPDRHRLVKALVDSFCAWSAYRRQRNLVAKVWREQIPKLRSRDAWQAIFELDALLRGDSLNKAKAD